MHTVNIQGPYNFDLVLSRLALDPLHVLDKEERWVKVPIRIYNQPIVVKVQADGTTENPVFRLELDEIDPSFHVLIIKEIRRIFRWDVSMLAIHEHFQKTNLNQIFDQHYGTPIVLDFHPYNSLVQCIIHQQLNLKFAFTLTKRFVTTYGSEKNGVWFYPLPETVAKLTVEDLRALQFTTRKAEYIIDLSKEIEKGNLNIDSLYEKSDEEIMTELLRYRGIGQWTIQNVLLFGLGRNNLFPIADIGIQNAIKKLLQLEQKPTKEEMEAMLPEWHPYLSYASLYLWRSIE
ncbi:DNA-3-methyladenine glycosylase [Niallia sp. JL1B1071]|uniref:DNA-3-methyladenine glycosylase family protein n=1 Tax=Niallia tiangongensis TaxID=3237105 RepID=UPI0037DC0325